MWESNKKYWVGDRGRAVLPFCGPVIVVVVVLFWAFLLTLGSALVIHPHLGSGVQISDGATPTDFMSALYTGGSSLSLVGSSELNPKSTGMQLFYLFNSLVGMSVLSLTLTYIMQIYAAMHSRNAFGLSIHSLTSGTADAAELIDGIWGVHGEVRLPSGQVGVLSSRNRKRRPREALCASLDA